MMYRINRNKLTTSKKIIYLRLLYRRETLRIVTGTERYCCIRALGKSRARSRAALESAEENEEHSLEENTQLDYYDKIISSIYPI